MQLVIAEKPSVAQSIAKISGATSRKNGYTEGNNYIVSWCVGHLVELAPADSYDENMPSGGMGIYPYFLPFGNTKFRAVPKSSLMC